MAPYKKEFDAKAYWAKKPYCSICKKHKVKNGTICYECKKIMEKEKIKSDDNIIKDESSVLFEVESSKENISISQSSFEKKDCISNEAQNKIVRLFTYLEKALALDSSVIRDFRVATAAPSPWWLADYPNDAENLYIRGIYYTAGFIKRICF